MNQGYIKFRSGFTLIELVVAGVVAAILVLVVGVLIVSATKGWQQTYNETHKQIAEEAVDVRTAFGSIGRKSNRVYYVIYTRSGSVFTPAVSATPAQDTVVSGDAVEFRYWDVPLDSGDTENLMDVTKTATAYALFYVDSDKLKVDYGSYPPGAVPSGGGSRNTSNVKTVILAENVSIVAGCGAFSHTSLNGVGYGSVRLNIILTDPNDGQEIRVSTSVLMRNRWPQ